jgi:predicted kinase
VVLRTDEVRKRMAGLAAAQPGSPALYSPDLYARAYDLMFDNARALLRAGRGVVLDATFIDEGLRGRAAQLAADCGVPFHGIWLDAPETALRDRIAARTGDASDATVAILEDQLGRNRGRMDWRAVDAAGPLDAAVAAWTARLAD